MFVFVVIFVCYGLICFLGKFFVKIVGQMMVECVWCIVVVAEGVDCVVVVMDDLCIIDVVVVVGGEVVMMDENCCNGMECVLDVLKWFESDVEIIINVQGDVFLILLWVIGDVVIIL